MEDFSVCITPENKSVVLRVYGDNGTDLSEVFLHEIVIPPQEDVNNIIFQISEEGEPVLSVEED